MYNVDVYMGDPTRKSAKLRQLGVKREWMSASTYHCYPVAFANTLGYGIYFEEDISFTWDGIKNNPAIANLGQSNIWSGRPEGTVSFDTNLVFKTDENTSILTMPVPNQYVEGATVLTSVIASSFFTGTFPVVWKLDKPDFEYVIPAGTNIACILPISIAQFQDANINVIPKIFPSRRIHNEVEYVDAIHNAVDQDGQQPKLYKKGVDHFGNKLGKHEVDRLVMKVTEIE